VRELLVAYRSHRLRTISGGSAAHVDVAATLRDLLKSSPGEALCEKCLAFAYAVTVAEIRMLTAALLAADSQHFRHAPMCASCRRTVPSIVFAT